jgi:hypothetical protein
LVAIGSGETIVGFQLAEKIRRFDEDQVTLAYAGVAPAFENRGHFAKNNQLPLVAEVKADNKCDMGVRLARYGFERCGDTNHQWTTNKSKDGLQ